MITRRRAAQSAFLLALLGTWSLPPIGALSEAFGAGSDPNPQEKEAGPPEAWEVIVRAVIDVKPTEHMVQGAVEPRLTGREVHSILVIDPRLPPDAGQLVATILGHTCVFGIYPSPAERGPLVDRFGLTYIEVRPEDAEKLSARHRSQGYCAATPSQLAEALTGQHVKIRLERFRRAHATAGPEAVPVVPGARRVTVRNLGQPEPTGNSIRGGNAEGVQGEEVRLTISFDSKVPSEAAILEGRVDDRRYDFPIYPPDRRSGAGTSVDKMVLHYIQVNPRDAGRISERQARQGYCPIPFERLREALVGKVVSVFPDR